MGDMADAILDGVFDQYTGEYIGKAVGYPRSVHNRKCKEKKATPPPCYISFVAKLLIGYTDAHEDITKAYDSSVLHIGNGVKHRTICKHIYNDVAKFKKWLSFNSEPDCELADLYTKDAEYKYKGRPCIYNGRSNKGYRFDVIGGANVIIEQGHTHLITCK